MDLDEVDVEDGLDLVTKTVKYLKDNGANYPSDGVAARWWSDEGTKNYRTGEETTVSYHLNGYTEDERKAIAEKM